MQPVDGRQMTPVRQQGFTLFELLVASIIFSIMAVMAYGGLDNIITNNASSQQALQRLQQIQKGISMINRDFSQIIQRGIRDEYGNPQPFLSAGSSVDSVVEFTRGGRANPASLLRSSLLRVAYRFEDEQLIRLQWSQLDRDQNMEPSEAILVDNIEEISLLFLDQNGEWNEQWPPLNAIQQGPQGGGMVMPVAIEIILQLKDWGDIRRLYAMN
jgi:general secretion pathway protein J